ncbi:MAG: histidinol-phosphate transaminase [Rubrivivax sp.]|nr:MAG: histidinol-phosphate transaminase [Rubrivivax sp.]
MPTPLDAALARIRSDVRAAHAYVVQASAGVIKLDAMENPYRLPPELQRALGERLGSLALNRYPAERTAELARALARYAGVPDDCGVTLGNGSDELIGLLSIAVAQPGAAVLAPVPGFVMYEAFARQQRLDFIGVPLRADDFQLDEPAMLAAVQEHQPALIYLAYPNNPTATLWDAAVIERIAQASRGIVVMDEAYQPFASQDSLALMARQPNVVVMRTMSKFGLAGVRIGYLLGAKELVDQVEKLRPPYNISVLNAEAAFFALEHAEVYATQAVELRQQRERLYQALQALPGVMPWPSEGNMILARVQDAAATFAALKARGVLIKNVSALHPLLANCLRFTVGTPDENTRLLAELQACLS